MTQIIREEKRTDTSEYELQLVEVKFMEIRNDQVGRYGKNNNLNSEQINSFEPYWDYRQKAMFSEKMIVRLNYWIRSSIYMCLLLLRWKKWLLSQIKFMMYYAIYIENWQINK